MKVEEIIKHWKDKGSVHIETEKRFRQLLDSYYNSLPPLTTDSVCDDEIEGIINELYPLNQTFDNNGNDNSEPYRDGFMACVKLMRSRLTSSKESEAVELKDISELSDKDGFEVCKIACWHPDIKDDYENIIKDLNVSKIERFSDGVKIWHTIGCFEGALIIGRDLNMYAIDENEEITPIYTTRDCYEYLLSKGYSIFKNSR